MLYKVLTRYNFEIHEWTLCEWEYLTAKNVEKKDDILYNKHWEVRAVDDIKKMETGIQHFII